jgi:hypothetical protein
MWISSSFSNITVDTISSVFSGGTGKLLQDLLRTLVHAELAAFEIAPPHKVTVNTTGAGSDGGVDLRYDPSSSARGEGIVVPRLDGVQLYSCKATKKWLDKVLGDLDPDKTTGSGKSKKGYNARARMIAETLAASPNARFVIVTSEAGSLDATRKIEEDTKHPGATAQASIAGCLSRCDPKHNGRRFDDQIVLVTAVQLEAALKKYKPALPDTQLTQLGVRRLDGWKTIDDLGAIFAKSQRQNRAAFVRDASRENVRKRLEAVVDSGALAIVCGPPGIGKTRAVYESLSRLDSERSTVSIAYAPNESALRQALREDVLDVSNLAMVVDDLSAADLMRFVHDLSSAKRARSTSVVLIVSAPRALIEEKLQLAPDHGFETIALDELDDGSIRQLLEAEMDGKSRDSLDDFVSLSEGYPWWAVLLARHATTTVSLRDAIERAITPQGATASDAWAALLLALLLRGERLSDFSVEKRGCVSAALGVSAWRALEESLDTLRSREIVRPPSRSEPIGYVSPALFAREVIVKELVEDAAKIAALRKCDAAMIERLFDALAEYGIPEQDQRSFAEHVLSAMRDVTVDSLDATRSLDASLLNRIAPLCPVECARWCKTFLAACEDAALSPRRMAQVAISSALTAAYRREGAVFALVEPLLRRLALLDEARMLNGPRHVWSRLFVDRDSASLSLEARIDTFERVVHEGKPAERKLALDVCAAWTANDGYLRAWPRGTSSDTPERSDAQRRVVDCFVLLLSDDDASVRDTAREQLNVVLGVRRSSNPWMRQVSERVAAQLVHWSAHQRSALLAALHARNSQRGASTDDRHAVAPLIDALAPRSMSERFRSFASQLAERPLPESLTDEQQAVLDELVRSDEEAFERELVWLDVECEPLCAHRATFALGAYDRLERCLPRIEDHVRRHPTSRSSLMYLLGAEDHVEHERIDEVLAGWDEGALVAARLEYIAQAKAHTDARAQWVVEAASSDAPDHWFERLLYSPTLQRSPASWRERFVDAMLARPSPNRAAIALRLCWREGEVHEGDDELHDERNARRAMQAMLDLDKWPSETRAEWQHTLLVIAQTDLEWAAEHLVAVVVKAGIRVPAPPTDDVLARWPRERASLLLAAVLRAFSASTRRALSWWLRSSPLLPEWTDALLEWAADDRDRALWVLTWLSAASATHEALFAALSARYASDAALMDELRSSIEAVLWAADGALDRSAVEVLRRHAERLGRDDRGWYERVVGSLERNRAA